MFLDSQISSKVDVVEMVADKLIFQRGARRGAARRAHTYPPNLPQEYSILMKQKLKCSPRGRKSFGIGYLYQYLKLTTKNRHKYVKTVPF